MKCFRNFNVAMLVLLLTFGSAVMFGASAAFRADFTEDELKLIEEHVYGGLPNDEEIFVRNGYVTSYNSATRTPNWSAYHITTDYRKTPSRKGRFKSFRIDPDIQGEAKDREYVGLLRTRGYARGHLAPYAVMGGDRDGDGQYAEYHRGSSDVGDVDEARTVYQANYMSNIVPQHHEGFNGWLPQVGSPNINGLWYDLERWIQDNLVIEEGNEVWVIAGCVFGIGEHEKVGPNKDIVVPPAFYKIVVVEDAESDIPFVLAYLFPHQRVRHGHLDAFLTSVDNIEALTGMDFFSELDEEAEEYLESTDTWEFATQRYIMNEE